MNNLGLLDNRSKLTPRESMQTLINYARDQDNKTYLRNRIAIRSYSFLSTLVFAPISFYLVYV